MRAKDKVGSRIIPYWEMNLHLRRPDLLQVPTAEPARQYYRLQA